MTKTRVQLMQLVNQSIEKSDLFKYFYDQPGSMPGTLRVKTYAKPPEIVLIDYNEEKATRLILETPEKCALYLDTESVSWIDVLGLGSEEILHRLGQVFNLHLLVLEDVVNVPQRPKVEDYDDHLVIITQMVMPKEKATGFYSEQVSFILGKHFLLTVQEEPEHDCFKPVRDRIRTAKGMIRQNKADYLAYALLDAIIDGFFPVLENYGERIEDLELEVVDNPTHQTLNKIYQIQRELLALRRAIWPQRDAINSLIRDGSNLISDEVRIYLRDCYDHAVQVMDMVENYRELASGLMDIYMSSVSNRMNETMKLLTVISSIFIPLIFVAGIYGMNFNTEKSPWNMPELNWYWGYPFCLGLMSAIALGLVLFFWKRGWFENFSTSKKNNI
ncbi:MAG TPA: magnesium/cobalt transporter CorA [Oculatellaceae cyanobacterium]|jgi:magnesium transporter